MTLDYYFWFAQPSTILNQFDKALALVFVGLLLVAVIVKVSKIFSKNSVTKKLLGRFEHLSFWIGLSGSVWFIFRYEATPIFAKRFWAGLVILLGIIWLAFIIKYLLFHYRKESKEFKDETLRKKYIS